jgi:hypothetical protein
VISDHAATPDTIPQLTERRSRSLIVDVALAELDFPCDPGAPAGRGTCDHHAGSGLSIVEAVRLAQQDHPGSLVMGIREEPL